MLEPRSSVVELDPEILAICAILGTVTECGRSRRDSGSLPVDEDEDSDADERRFEPGTTVEPPMSSVF